MFRSLVVTTGCLGAGEVLCLVLLLPVAQARPPDGVALVFGATICSVDDSLIVPHPLSPDDLVRIRPGTPGRYDVWFHLFTRRPLVGAWTIDFALEFDRRPGHGIDIESWESLAFQALPHAGWPDAGTDHGIRLKWRRPDCFDEEHADLFQGRDGWFRQSALRLRVRVHGPDAMLLADPEPGVPAELVQCFDDAFRMDGEDGWTRYLGPVFTIGESAEASDPRSPVRSVTWGGLKARVDTVGSHP